MTSTGDSCSNCRFWDRYDGGAYRLSGDLGDCRRRSPQISETLLARQMPGFCQALPDELELAVYPASAFPVTHETSWCGEYQNGKDEVIV